MRSLIIDTETTGVDPGQDRICAIGLILTDWKTVYCAVSSLVNPEITFDNKHNGLNTQAVQDAPVIAELLPFVYTMLLYADEYVAHNWPFDRRFLGLELTRAGVGLPSRPIFDTMRACSGRTLQESCLRLGIPVSDLKFHEVMDDCIAVLRLCMKIRPHGPEKDGPGGSEVALTPRF